MSSPISLRYVETRLWSALIGITLATAGYAQERRIPLEARKSGIEMSGPDVRSLQADDFQNPGMLWVERGAKLWNEVAGSKSLACASCHKRAEDSMRGVSARYPRFDNKLGRVLNLEGRINACRVEHQGTEPFRFETQPMLSMAAYLNHQSRGMPIAVAIDGPARPAFEAGERLYFRRMGQMNLACTHCHDANWGRRLLNETISQGHGNAYPIYRLEWQTAGSLHRRFRSCLFGVRAEMWPYGVEEYVQLELYLAWRAQGLLVETPGVRR